MNTAENRLKLSDVEFARLGGGRMAYIREIGMDRASLLIGEGAMFPQGGKLFCLYGADGTPMAISATQEAAIANAFQHELLPMPVH
ncbi:MAG: DUF1150 domain-containing protein [Pseudomonadota bacterium]|nr:DUF1150 domain-containing protein [Pseudomonadota bacterium]